jgi:bacillopeptidase F (M6 metalloprotease family)
VGWTEYSYQGWAIILHLDNTYISTQGFWLAWLGGDYDDTARLSQTVTISASQPYLHFAYWIASEDYCAYDYAHVKIDSTTIHTFDLCETENTAGWNNYWINLSTYAGSTVTLMFEVTTDSSYNSNFFLDNVSLSSDTTNPSIEPDQGEDLSGVILDKHHFEGLK